MKDTYKFDCIDCGNKSLPIMSKNIIHCGKIGTQVCYTSWNESIHECTECGMLYKESIVLWMDECGSDYSSLKSTREYSYKPYYGICIEDII